MVSIRAPLARGDRNHPSECERWRCFNPRPSCEGRSKVTGHDAIAEEFQSAPLLRGAILGPAETPNEVMFQSAPLLRGAISEIPRRLYPSMFQSAPLLRGAIGVAHSYAGQ